METDKEKSLHPFELYHMEPEEEAYQRQAVEAAGPVLVVIACVGILVVATLVGTAGYLAYLLIRNFF